MPFPDNFFDKKGGEHNGIGFDQSNDSNVILINGGNGALDYAGTATISGGTLVTVGASGMAQNFSTDSTQGCMLVTVSDTLTEGELSLTDSNGNVLVSCSPSKGYNSVVVSCPKLSEGETYTLTTGDISTTVKMSSLIYGTDDRFMGDGGFPGKEKRGQ